MKIARIDPESLTPHSAKAIQEVLGAQGLLTLPIDLTQSLRADINAHQDGVAGRAHCTRAALAVLRRSLALATNPGSSAYVGDGYLSELVDAGRSTFPPGSTVPNGVAGYQGLATIIQAEGDDRFSPAFFEDVGRNMITYDRGVRARCTARRFPIWQASTTCVAPGTGIAPVSILGFRARARSMATLACAVWALRSLSIRQSGITGNPVGNR